MNPLLTPEMKFGMSKVASIKQTVLWYVRAASCSCILLGSTLLGAPNDAVDFPRNRDGKKEVKTKRPDRDPNTGKWTKLDYFRLENDGSYQLYNLDIDPEEKNNLANEHPEMVKELHSLLNRYRTRGRSVPVEQVDGVND